MLWGLVFRRFHFLPDDCVGGGDPVTDGGDNGQGAHDPLFLGANAEKQGGHIEGHVAGKEKREDNGDDVRQNGTQGFRQDMSCGEQEPHGDELHNDGHDESGAQSLGNNAVLAAHGEHA